MLGEAVVLNGSGAIAATTVGWRGEDANAFAAVVEANDTLLEALQPEASLCEIQGATRHYRNQSFPRGAHMALGLSWCAAAIARHEAAHGQRFGLVAYARPDQFFAGPVTPWCRWPSATTALACHAPGSDGFWAAPRDLAAQIFGMIEALAACQPGQAHLGSYQCTHGPTQVKAFMPINCHIKNGRRLATALRPACCGESNEALLARVLHRPTPVPIASNGGCNTLFPLLNFKLVRLSGDAPCSVLPSSFWRGLYGGHVWAKRILAGSGFAQAMEGAKQLRHIFLDAVGTPGNLTVGELDATHSGPGSRPLTSWTEGHLAKIEAAAIEECRKALKPLDATWATTTWATRTWAPLVPNQVLNGTGRRLADVPPAPDSPLNGMLSATIDVARLRANGTLPIPPGTTEIIMEIGANTRNTADLELLPHRPGAYLISFEPLLDKYGTLLSRNSMHDHRSPLGHHHKRGLVLPFAVAKRDGFATFHLDGTVDGCASLLNATGRRSIHGCASTGSGDREERRVPTVSLRTVLGRWLAWEEGGGWPVAYLKIDSQGMDVQVLESAGELMGRIQQVEMEVVRDTCPRMYEAAPSCSESVEAMARFGFTAEKTCASARFPGAKQHGRDRIGCEDDFIFSRNGHGRKDQIATGVTVRHGR